MGQSAWYQFTTADRSGNNHRLFIRRWAFCQSRGGSCPKHHIRRNVCLLRWPRKGGPREAAETKREGSHDRNHRLAFFSFKHPLHQPPPDLSSIPCRLSSRSKECSCTRSFPLFTSEAKGCVSDVFLPAVLSDAFQSLRFRFFSLTSCSTLVPQYICVERMQTAFYGRPMHNRFLFVHPHSHPPWFSAEHAVQRLL